MSKVQNLTFTFLGCGTSSGVPLLQCPCKVCHSKNKKNKRLRASAWIEVNGKNLIIDTSTDFRTQALREDIKRVDAVLYTHPHADHIHGIDDLRAFNFIQNESIPIYAHSWTYQELKHKFEYIFKKSRKKHLGGGLPKLDLNLFRENASSIKVCGIKITPIPLPHGRDTTIGYRIGDLAYLTDCHDVPNQQIKKLSGLDVLVLDCVRITPHKTHLHLEKSIEIARKIDAKRTYFTHLGHEFDYEKVNQKLPPRMKLAFDGLKIRL